MAGKEEPAATSFAFPGTDWKRRRFFPASVIISGFLPGHPPCCGFRSGLPGPPPAEHHGQTNGGRFIRYTQHIAGPAHWTGYAPTPLTRYISTDENERPGSGWHRAPRAGFRRLHRASRGDASFTTRRKRARLAGQQRLTGGGQRRTDTPRIFCHLVTDTAYRIAYRTKNGPDFVLCQPLTGIRKDTCVPSAGSTGSDCT